MFLVWAGIVAVFSIFGIVSLVLGRPFAYGLPWLTRHCRGAGFGCNVVTQFLFPLAAFAVGYALFVVWRYRRVRKRYVRFARERPSDLVETAGSIVGAVVGRDDLCEVLIDDLREGARRQPHVLIGTLGIGKTAVLVHLTKLLAERGAVPVPIRLRDAEGELDFLALAQRRFAQVVSSRVRSTAEVERIWHELRADDRIVVLADGLEEALTDQASYDRDHRVRIAVRAAAEQRFPLIIASRPHAALRAIEAASVHIEPLSAEAALAYILGHEPGDESRLDRVVEIAGVTDTPLYLRIARELHAERLLEHQSVDTRGADRVPLRLRLMESWLRALVDARLQGTADVPLTREQRIATVAHLEALACMGLRYDTQEVDLDKHWAAPLNAGSKVAAVLRNYIDTHLASGAGVARTRELQDMPAAVSRGVQLRLIDPVGAGARFPHSIMQAYLGSRALKELFERRVGEVFVRQALENPGRELLLALVMYARTPAREASVSMDSNRTLVFELLSNVQAGSKRLLVLTAAIEVATEIELSRLRTPPDEAEPESHICEAADKLIATWMRPMADDDETRFAKYNAIDRLADAARLLNEEAQRRSAAVDPATQSTVPTAGVYPHLYKVCRIERRYELRLAAARRIGNGGAAAWMELRGWLTDERRSDDDAPRHGDDGQWKKILERLELREDPDPAGPTIEAPHVDSHDAVLANVTERRYAVKGWLLPMIVGSIPDEADWHAGARQEAKRALTQWVDLVGEEGGMPLMLEAALAQGFKHAANRRPSHSHEQATCRAFLLQQATEMIHKARFWYSRVTLLHALCLWELTRVEFPSHAELEAVAPNHDPSAQVERWLRRGSEAPRDKRRLRRQRQADHPFVLETAELVLATLHDRNPARHIWLDESQAVATIGSREVDRAPLRQRRLWIPPSAGWSALDRRAQQLLTDVQLLLNLAERGEASATAADGASSGERAWARERRLRNTNVPQLPVCLTGERGAHLKPLLTVGMAAVADPGDDCARNCPVRLCPYPPRGQQPFRAELSEALCRRQVRLVRFPTGRAAWQEGSSRELRRFWRDMEARARK